MLTKKQMDEQSERDREQVKTERRLVALLESGVKSGGFETAALNLKEGGSYIGTTAESIAKSRKTIAELEEPDPSAKP
jgi:hypothetical protein